ncbi:hypothetical protein PHYPSEUDO_006089 [Phytophthora pseudosyringae]|uniref:Uncharacterized protein n=1 Tax=Phytophthora pseudosyringae TaxID=221518 RepID=A0A8T1VPQ3_9STRA|nr:hypothetical protein PHYPSEUDO_006089 [Phytophthora pseudosyringae]
MLANPAAKSASHPGSGLCWRSRKLRALFRRLEAAYEEIDVVFAANGLSDVQLPIQVRRGVDDKHIELFESKVLPISWRDTGEAARDHFKGIEKHLGNGGLYGKAMKTLKQPYTLLEDFQKAVFSKNLRADMQAKQFVRRCVEPERDMIVFVSSMTPIQIKHKAINGITYHVREYALSKQAPLDSTPGRDLSLLQLCTRISMECKPGVTFDAENIRSVARFWVGNIAGNLRCYQERIENALLDQAVTSRAE